MKTRLHKKDLLWSEMNYDKFLFIAKSMYLMCAPLLDYVEYCPTVDSGQKINLGNAF